MARITAISTLGWAHYTLYEALPRIMARGFRQVEICSFDSYCFHFNYGSPTVSELKVMLADFNLTPIVMHLSRGKHNAWDPSDMERFVSKWERKMAQLPELGISMMSMVFGERNDRDDQERQLANAVKAYDQVARTAKALGIRMLLEVPHLYTIMPGTEQVFWIFERLESDNIGALVDSSHWGIIGYDIDDFFSRLGDRLWHIHLRDSRGTDSADRKQELELTPGDGTVDYSRFSDALDRAGYRGDVSLEFEYRDMTLDAIENEYDKGLAHLRKCGWKLPDTVKTELRS